MIKQLMLISSIISVPFNVFAEPSENDMREFTTKSSKITVEQTGEDSNGIVIQQDANGTKINAWPQGNIVISENKENNSNNTSTPNSAIVTQTTKNSKVSVKQKGSNNHAIVKQSGNKNSVIIRQE